jgi:D-alanyl-D-alanine carboxypeptidase
VHSPAAGRVRAKTGTGAMPNGLGGNLLLEAKALAGYIDTPADTIAFAVYVNYVPVTDLSFVLSEAGPGEAIGEIVTAVYRSVTGATQKETR